MRLYFALQTLRKPLIFLFFLLTLGVAAWAQAENREIYSIVELQDMQKAAIGKELLSDEMRDTVAEQYSAAIEAVKQVEEFLSFRDEYQQELILTGQVQASLLEELAVPESSPVVDFPELMTVDQAENALARERARHSANLAELHDQQLIADDMSVSRSNISQHLGELDLRIDLLNREYRSQQGSTEIDIIRRAEKLRILSLKAAAESESEMLRARLELLTGKSQYVPLNIDLAQRRVSYSQELVDIYKNHVLVLQAEQAVSSLKFVHKMSDQLLSDFPQLSELIEETELMALNLWGPDGIIELSEQTSQDLSEARTFQTQLRRIAELTRRKFETYGNRGNLYRWWPQLPDNFPEHGKVSRIIDNLDVEIPEVDYQLINLSQKRSKAYELIRITLVALDRERSEKLSAADEQRIRNYLDIRQNLLDQLIQRGGVYATQLVEYQEVSRNFLNQINEVESFLFSHVLWSRSVPKPIIPKFRDILATAAWLVSPSHWHTFSIRAVSPDVFLLLIFLLLVISFRKILYRRLNYISAKVMNPEEDSFSLTPRALVLTILLALPLPLGLVAAGKLTGIFGESLYWVAISRAFNQMALVMALLETARMVFIEHGLAETHFSWPVQTIRRLYKGLLKSEIMGMPILWLSLFLVFAGGRLDSQLDYRVYHNSLGRLAFILSLMIMGLSILSLIKPEKQKNLSPDYARVPWPRRFSAYAFPKVFLGAYPIIFIATVIPSLLSISGYYLTALLLAYQMLRTMILLLIVFLISGIIQRSIQLATQKQKNTHSNDSERQTRGMYKFLMVAVISIGVVFIWSDALPMLQFLKRVQILPSIQMIDTQDEFMIDYGDAPNTEGLDQVLSAEDDQTSTDENVIADVTGTSVEKSSQKSPLTLWMIIEAILAAGIAVVLIRGLPDIIDLILRHRASIDHGARFAVRTLLKYSLSIIGTIVVFNFLGLKWSQIQWLAAALTFGLGFGLQEIVANFVSGLILLIERPIRVNDVVTIGDLMGKVSRIQIRATTITLWDRSEMVVPNKEFVTTKLVNWTLSDSKRRIDIPLRVVYGTSLDEVKAILVACAVENPLVLDDPQPHAIIIDFATDAINIELRFVVDFGNGIQVRDEVQMAVDRIFKEKGIAFAMPQVNVQMTQAKPLNE